MGLKKLLFACLIASLFAASVVASSQDLTTQLSSFLTSLSAGTVAFGGTKSKITSTVDGTLLLSNNAVTDLSLIQLGGTTSSFPAIKRSTTNAQIRLADDSGYTGLVAGAIGIGSGSPASGAILFTPTVFASLGTPTNGTILYCSDCTVTTAATCPATQASCVCAASGAGAFARRINGAWYCTF